MLISPVNFPLPLCFLHLPPTQIKVLTVPLPHPWNPRFTFFNGRFVCLKALMLPPIKLWRISESSFQLRTLGGEFLTLDNQGLFVSVTAESSTLAATFVIERYQTKVHIKLPTGNYLQIPVGWWIAQDPNPPAPFVGGALAALDNAFSWAQAFALKCIIDLHAAPGSQNGMEHSASRDGSSDWASSPYISQTLAVIDFLSSRYANHPSLLGIELLNEPSASSVPLDVIVSYYSKGHQIVRNHSSTVYVIFCQRIGTDDPLELHQANIGFSNFVVDLHFYNLFDNAFVNMSAEDNIRYIYQSRQNQVQTLTSANGPLIFICEWVSEWDVINRSKEQYQDYGRAQLRIYNKASFGWSYWTLKNARAHWDFEWNIKNDYLQIGSCSSKYVSMVPFLVTLASITFLIHHDFLGERPVLAFCYIQRDEEF